MDLHSERMEAKLNAVDWAVRDVLVAARSSWIYAGDIGSIISRRSSWETKPFRSALSPFTSPNMYSARRQASSTTARSRSAAWSAGATSRSFGHGRGQSRTFIIALRSGNGSG